MTVAKTMEISARSPESFDHAIRHGLERAAKTVQGIKGAWVKDQKVEFDGKNASSYVVHMKVTFELRE
jgi:dodecin